MYFGCAVYNFRLDFVRAQVGERIGRLVISVDDIERMGSGIALWYIPPSGQ